MERHGSIHFLQCVDRCTRELWPADGLRVEVDEATIRSRSEPPRCPKCGAIARPNILMFGDFDWLRSRHDEQQARYEEWLRRVDGKRVVAIELGAGLAIPTVRYECERRGNVLIRVNPREADTPEGGIPIRTGALEALRGLDELLWGRGNGLEARTGSA